MNDYFYSFEFLAFSCASSPSEMLSDKLLALRDEENQ